MNPARERRESEIRPVIRNLLENHKVPDHHVTMNDISKFLQGRLQTPNFEKTCPQTLRSIIKGDDILLSLWKRKVMRGGPGVSYVLDFVPQRGLWVVRGTNLTGDGGEDVAPDERRENNSAPPDINGVQEVGRLNSDSKEEGEGTTAGPIMPLHSDCSMKKRSDIVSVGEQNQPRASPQNKRRRTSVGASEAFKCEPTAPDLKKHLGPTPVSTSSVMPRVDVANLGFTALLAASEALEGDRAHPPATRTKITSNQSSRAWL